MTSSHTDPPSGDPPDDPTSIHIRRARAGEPASVEWLVKRFSPLLMAAAQYRLGATLRALYDPEDIVNDVWLVALPRMAGLPPRGGRVTPVVLKFLTTTLTFKINNLIAKHITGKPGKEPRRKDTQGGQSDPLAELSSDTVGVVTRVARRECKDTVWQALERLEPQDRELIILRGIEGLPYKEIVLFLGGDPVALAGRYRDAIRKLRSKLPNSIFDELERQ